MGTVLLLVLLTLMFFNSGWLLGALWLMLGLGIVHHNFDVTVPPVGYVGAFVATLIIKTVWNMLTPNVDARPRTS